MSDPWFSVMDAINKRVVILLVWFYTIELVFLLLSDGWQSFHWVVHHYPPSVQWHWQGNKSGVIIRNWVIYQIHLAAVLALSLINCWTISTIIIVKYPTVSVNVSSSVKTNYSVSRNKKARHWKRTHTEQRGRVIMNCIRCCFPCLFVVFASSASGEPVSVGCFSCIHFMMQSLFSSAPQMKT